MQGPSKIPDIVYQMAKPVVEEKGLELVSVEFVKEGANWYLRVYIDKDGGVDLEDCQSVSHPISELLDKKDPIPQAYFLEISSPGIERLLQRESDFHKYYNSLVNVHTFAPFNGKKKFSGKLGAVTHEQLAITLADDTIIQIPREKISQVRLAWQD